MIKTLNKLGIHKNVPQFNKGHIMASPQLKQYKSWNSPRSTKDMGQ